MLSGVRLCKEKTVSIKQISSCVEEAILINYTHPDEILIYVSVVSQGPPELKQLCEDLYNLCRGHKKPDISTYYLLLNVTLTTSEI